MTQEQLITKQQLEIEEYRKLQVENKKLKNQLNSKFYAIGAPLNDNNLKFNKEQMWWCFEVYKLIEQINTRVV